MVLLRVHHTILEQISNEMLHNSGIQLTSLPPKFTNFLYLCCMRVCVSPGADPENFFEGRDCLRLFWMD